MITKTARIKASPRISIADLGGEAVILDAQSGQYFGVNKVGLFILDKIKEEQTVGATAMDVAEHFGISLEQAETDLISFLNELKEAKLVSSHQE